MKRDNRAPKFILLALFLLLLLASGYIFLTRMHTKPIADKNTNVVKDVNRVNEQTQNIPQDTTVDNTSTIKDPANIALDIKTPILMYHHIRDYNNADDKIGVNLSVPTAKFAGQLDWLIKNNYTSITFDDLRHNNLPEKPIILTFDDGYDNFYINAYPELKKRNMKAVVFVIADYKKAGYLSDSQIKEMAANNIEIGSHTLSHADLSVTDAVRAEKEIRESKSELEIVTGQKIQSFCYPAGKYTPATIDIVKNSGYDLAVTTKSGMGDFIGPFELKRYRVNNDTNISGYLK